MASQQVYQVFAENPLTPALTDVVPFQPNDAGVTAMGANTWQSIKNLFIPYKVWSGIVSNSSGTFTVTNEIKEIGSSVTFTFTINSNGVLYLTASSPVFTTGKSVSLGSSLLGGGVPYFLNGFQLTTSIFEFDIIKHDGTQSGTPNFSEVLFEIRVYN